MILGSVRKIIRFLQIYPIITTFVIILDVILDFMHIYITSFLCGFFGTSLFITIGLYLLSKTLYVSTWAKSLYLALIAVLLFDITDQLFHFIQSAIVFNELILLITGVGIIASLLTFIYDKYRYKF